MTNATPRQRDPRAIAEALARLNPKAAQGYMERAEKREKIEREPDLPKVWSGE